MAAIPMQDPWRKKYIFIANDAAVYEEYIYPH